MTSAGSSGIGHFALNIQPCCNKPLFEPEKQKVQGRAPSDLSRYCQCNNSSSSYSQSSGGGPPAGSNRMAGMSNFGTNSSSSGGAGMSSNANYIRAISGGLAFSSDMDAR